MNTEENSCPNCGSSLTSNDGTVECTVCSFYSPWVEDENNYFRDELSIE